MKLRVCCALFWFFCWILPMLAQAPAGSAASVAVPPVIQISDLATDEAGTPLVGAAEITFSLYNNSQAGQPLWMETQHVVLDNTGHYSVYLGITKTNGVPTSLFTSGQAHWLGVKIAGQAEQPRIFLVSVPYAMKAGDAATVGGLPPSAFMLAAPVASGAPSSSDAASPPTTGLALTPAIGGGGTQDYLPLWTDSNGTLGNSILYQLGSGTSAKIGINEKNPLFTLDVNGQELVRGLMEMATISYATSAKGYNSNPFNFESSAFNSGTGKYTLNHFQWQAEPTGNNTATTGATLNLLYGTDPNLPTETGLKLSSTGLFTFAPGQSFPGAGTVSSVGLTAPSSDFTVSGSPVTKSGTLGLGWKVVPTNSNTANAIVKRDASGGFIAGQITASTSASNGAVIGTNFGSSAFGPGVAGISNEGFGVSGTSTDGYGVYGNGFNGVGVYGVTSGGSGVFGDSATGDGVDGYTAGPGYGLSGTNVSENGTGVFGYGAEGGFFLGLPLTEASGPGALLAEGADNVDYYGEAGASFFGGAGSDGFSGGDGLYAYAGSPGPSYAGFFFGDLEVTGNISKGGGSFKIDHPLDPANKYLSHSFVESPDMMNVYNGNMVLDGNGEATIQLPDWFETLNRDFRYQLTSIGGFAPLYIAQKVQNNAFKIAGGKPGMEISWQVTGIRQDRWANAHRIPVEQEKDARERGFYLHPELYNQPAEKGMTWARNPVGMKRMQRRRKSLVLPRPASQKP